MRWQRESQTTWAARVANDLGCADGSYVNFSNNRRSFLTMRRTTANGACPQRSTLAAQMLCIPALAYCAQHGENDYPLVRFGLQRRLVVRCGLKLRDT